jgi:hypothetical protein
MLSVVITVLNFEMRMKNGWRGVALGASRFHRPGFNMEAARAGPDRSSIPKESIRLELILMLATAAAQPKFKISTGSSPRFKS